MVFQNNALKSKFVVRRKYPKCTMPAASLEHPGGFKSVKDAFSWRSLFLERICQKFNVSWVCDRLEAWKWNFSSAFSGIGAPESAQGSVFFFLLGSLSSKHVTNFLCPRTSTTVALDPISRKRLEILLRHWPHFKLQRRMSSSQMAATQPVLETLMSCVNLLVKLTPTVRVLRDTYGCCCYPDIMKFDSQNPPTSVCRTTSTALQSRTVTRRETQLKF